MQTSITDFEEWLRYIRKIKSDRTIKEYTYYLKKFMSYPKLDMESCKSFFKSQNKGVEENNYVALAFLKNLYLYYKGNKSKALEDGLDINEILDIDWTQFKREKTITKIYRVPTYDEIIAITDAMDYEKHRIMLLIQYSGAMRTGELFKITYNDIFLQEWYDELVKNNLPKPTNFGSILVTGKGNKQRLAVIEPEVMTRLYNWIRTLDLNISQKTEPLWGKDSKQKTWHDIFSKACKKALNKHLKCHSIRHAKASHLLSQGLDIRKIQEHLGHSDISSTQIYTHYNRDQLKEDLMKIKEKQNAKTS